MSIEAKAIIVPAPALCIYRAVVGRFLAKVKADLADPKCGYSDGVIRPGLVHHLAVQVSKLGDAEHFYVRVLGLPVLKRWFREDGSERSLWLDLGGGMFLAVEEVEPGSVNTETAPGWHCAVLSIDRAEREAWAARLTEAGHPVVRETDFTIYVRDPEGALVGLSHHPSKR